MAKRTISDDALLSASVELFRRYGYDGVSLSQLAAATGLEKASLYYRFPGGKEQIAQAAIDSVTQWFDRNISVPLRSTASPRRKALRAAMALKNFYANGEKSCVLDVLSLPIHNDALRERLAHALGQWMAAFAALSKSSGCGTGEADKRAGAALVSIQGSLVLSRVTGDTAFFLQAIRALPDLLTAAPERLGKRSQL